MSSVQDEQVVNQEEQVVNQQEQPKVITVQPPSISINVPMNVSTEFYIDLMNNLIHFLDGKKLDMENIISATLSLMILLEKSQGMTGVQKKVLLLHLLEDYVDKHVFEEDDKEHLQRLIKLSLPKIVDVLIMVDKGLQTISIKQVKKRCLKLFC